MYLTAYVYESGRPCSNRLLLKEFSYWKCAGKSWIYCIKCRALKPNDPQQISNRGERGEKECGQGFAAAVTGQGKAVAPRAVKAFGSNGTGKRLKGRLPAQFPPPSGVPALLRIGRMIGTSPWRCLAPVSCARRTHPSSARSPAPRWCVPDSAPSPELFRDYI
jgi:hypothetical protein